MFELCGDKEPFELFLREWRDIKPYIEAKTSGSTGTPKTIRLPKSDMIVSAVTTIDFFEITSESTLYCPLSVNYIAGKMMLVRAVEAGCRLIIESPSNNLSFDSFSKDAIIDLICIVPSQVPSLIKAVDNGIKIKHVIVGGAPLSSDYENMLIMNGIKAHVTYGMTETCSHVALRRVGEKSYQPLSDISLKVTHDGRLVIKSFTRSFGELTTNDIVELLPQGGFVWKGRADNVINSGGVKIHPEEIEEILRNVIPFPFAVTSQPDNKWGEVPIVVIETNEEKMNAEAILRTFKDLIPRRKLPKNVYQVPKLPFTHNGKLDRIALKLLIEILKNSFN